MLSIRIVGDGLEIFDNVTRALSEGEIKVIAARAMNHTGAKVRTQVTRALTKQTGLKRKVIVKALKISRATAGNPKHSYLDSRMEFRIRASGADIGLHHFDPQETDDGVVARPFGKRTVFPGTFIYGGPWWRRASRPIAGGRVLFRSSGKRLPIDKAKSGVVIPKELVQGETAKAFAGAAEMLEARIAHEMGFSRDLQEFTKGARF